MPSVSRCIYTLLKYNSPIVARVVCDLFQMSCLNFQWMFYIEKPGRKIVYDDIPHGEKGSLVGLGTPLQNPKNPTSYLGWDSISKSEASCYSTSRGAQNESVLFCFQWLILGVSREEMPLRSRSIFRFSLHRLWEGEGITRTLHKWKVRWSHIEQVASGHDREHGPALWSSCSAARCSAQTLLFTAFCQMPLRRWKMQELKHRQRALMGDTSEFMLTNIYWVLAKCLLPCKLKRPHGPYTTTFIWLTSKVATQPFSARLESFAISWLPMRQLNLPVPAAVVVARLCLDWAAEDL